MCFHLQNCSMKLTVGSETTRMVLSNRTRYSNLEQNLFIFHFFSDNLSHHKTSDYRKFLMPDAFKHVPLQNTYNRCKNHQILPLMVDYACFLLKCINYQNVMCIQIIYFLQVRKILQELKFL